MTKYPQNGAEVIMDPRVPELERIATLLQRRFLLDLFRQTSAKRLSIPQFTLLGFLAVESACADGDVGQTDGACDLCYYGIGGSVGGGRISEAPGPEGGSAAEVGGNYNEGERVDGAVAGGVEASFERHFESTRLGGSGCLGSDLSGNGELLP